jgi:pimeloyl-ACP methyl ester carboxylesterase
MDLSNQTIKLKDGRTLGFAEYGDLKGKPLFFFHGWPSARIAAEKYDVLAKKLHIHLISPDRPGYGYSDFKKDRKILDWPDDVVQLANILKIKKFVILGASGGGPYAVACAYKIPERLTRVGIVSGVAPLHDWKSLDGMPGIIKFGWVNLGNHPKILRIFSLIQLMYIRTLSSSNIHNRFFGAPTDREIYTHTSVGAAVTQGYAEAFRQGYKGPELDLKLYTTDWGFDVSRIRGNIYLWYGTDDRTVSPSMGKYYHVHIPGSSLTMYEGEGHLVTVTHAEEIFKTLIS